MRTLLSALKRLPLAPRGRTMLVAACFALVGVGALVLPAAAQTGTAQGLLTDMSRNVALLIAYGAYYFAGFLGEILLNMVEILIWVAQYNDFVSAAPIVHGWVIIRDVVNMFFILALLLIAFGTILGVEQYTYRKQLVKLLLMAIIVNFSRTIAGLIIDFSQVIMLTFVTGFASAAGGNFISAFRMNELYQASPSFLDDSQNAQADNIAWQTAVTMLLALLMTIISLAVIVIMTVLLLQRIVQLWLLVVLSPLAFFLNGVPGGFGQSYYKDWWQQFTKYVISGPLLAFFLWLSLVTLASSGQSGMLGQEPADFGESRGGAFSDAFKKTSMGNFIVAIALLLGGTQRAVQMSGGLAAKMYGAAEGYAKKQVTGAVAGAAGWGAAGLRRATLGKKVKDEKTGKEVYRGGLLTANVPLTTGLQRMAGKGLGLGGYANKDQYRSDLYREATDAENRRDPVKASQLRQKADRLGKSFRDQSLGEKAATVAGKAFAATGLGLVGTGLRRSAMESDRKKDIEVREDLGKRRERIAKMDPQEIEDMALGKIKASGSDRAAAIFEASKKGMGGLRGKHKELQEFLASWSGPLNVDAQTVSDYGQSLRDHYWLESDMGVTGADVTGAMPTYPGQSEKQVMDTLIEQRRQSAADNGRLPITEKTKPSEIKEMAKYIAAAPAAVMGRTIDRLSGDQRQAMREALLEMQSAAPDAAAFSDKYIGALMSVSKGSDKPHAQAYGVMATERGTYFGDTKNAEGAQLRTGDENRQAYVDSYKKKGADKNLLKLSPEDLVKDGQNTDLMDATLEGLSDSPNVLEAIMKGINSGEVVGQEREVFDAVLAAIGRSRDERLKKYITKGRSAISSYVERQGISIADEVESEEGADDAAPAPGGATPRRARQNRPAVSDSGARELDLGGDDQANA